MKLASSFRKSGPAAAATGVLLALLAGCGGGSSSTSNNDTTPPPVVPPVVSTATLSATVSQGSVVVNNAVTYTLTLKNGNSSAVTGAAFNFLQPSGPISTSSLNLSSPCTHTGYSLGSSGLMFSGVTIPANSSCTYTFVARPNTVGTAVGTATGLVNVTLGAMPTLTVTAN